MRRHTQQMDCAHHIEVCGHLLDSYHMLVRSYGSKIREREREREIKAIMCKNALRLYPSISVVLLTLLKVLVPLENYLDS